MKVWKVHVAYLLFLHEVVNSVTQFLFRFHLKW